MNLRYLILFVSAIFIACDAQSSTESTSETDLMASSAVEEKVPAVTATSASTKEEEMQKDAPAMMESTTAEPESEEKPTTEAATTPKEPSIAPTRPKMKGTSEFPPLVHSSPAEEPTPGVKQDGNGTTEKPDGNKNGSSPIHSSVVLIIVGLAGMVFRYQSY